MKDIATYETAVRLKEAGFPQPAIKEGQVWYMIKFDTPRLAIVGLWATADKRPVCRYLDANTWDFPDERESIFAPTATDILRMMQDYELLSFATQDPMLFIDTITDVEALAAMWLGLNPKT